MIYVDVAVKVDDRHAWFTRQVANGLLHCRREWNPQLNGAKRHAYTYRSFKIEFMGVAESKAAPEEHDPLARDGEYKWHIGMFECLADPATCTLRASLLLALNISRLRNLQACARAAALGTASG